MRTFEQTELTKLIVQALDLAADLVKSSGHPELAKKFNDLFEKIENEKLDVTLYPRES